MNRKNDITVPEGYFEDLKDRLSAIGRSGATAPKVPVVRRIAPYFAVAASMLIAVLIGNGILSRTAVRDTQGDFYETMLIAEVLNTADPAGFFDMEPEEEVTDDDIINDLISSGISLEQINYSVRYEDFR